MIRTCLAQSMDQNGGIPQYAHEKHQRVVCGSW